MKLVTKLAVVVVAVLLLCSMVIAMPTTAVFAGFTPTPTSPPPATDTPVPPPPTNTPEPSDSGGTDSGTPVEMTPTPVPTPDAIPELGGGPGAGQMSMMGFVLCAIFLLLAFAWWRAWQLYQKQDN